MSKKHLYGAGLQLEQDAPADGPGLWQRAELRLQVGNEAGPLWPRLEERLASVRSYPRLHPGTVLKAVAGDGGAAAYLLSDPARGRYFRLGEREANLIPLLDGKREVQEVARDYADRFGPVSVPAVERFLYDLRLAGLLDERAGLWQRLSAPRRSGPLILWTLPGAEDRLAALHHAVRGLLTPVSGVVALFLFLGGLALWIVRFPALGADLAVLRAAWWMLPVLLALVYTVMVPVVVTHELAHALACVHAGGRVARFGLMVHHLLPAAFADVSDVWTLPRASRIGVFLAGPASTALWAAAATALWSCTPAGSWVHVGLAAVMLAIWYSLLVGLVPVAGYDGSEVLGEWLRVPNLHRRALGLFGAGRTELAGAAPRERRILQGYAAGFVAYNLAVVTLIALAVWQVV
jgi:putative peptide zinc metalloprotease protein